MARGTLRRSQLPRVSLCCFVCLTFFLSSPAFAADVDPWLARDKALHFDGSAGLAALGYAVSAGWLVDARWKALAVGGGLAIAAGAGKELLDATHVFGGDPSWKDFAWDALGAVAGLALAWGVDLLIGGIDAERPAFGPARLASSQATITVGF